MDWHEVTGILAGLAVFGSAIPYIKGMLFGTTRPSITSWSLYFLLQIISIAAQFSAGASWSIIILFVSTFNISVILILCVFGYGYKKHGLADLISIILFVLALLLWYLTDAPITALLLAVAADAFASIPTIVKSYKDPHSENLAGWFVYSASGVLSLLAAFGSSPANFVWPIYILLLGFAITLIILVGQRGKKPKF